MTETDPSQVLRQARQLVKSQQYAAALEKYIWFHDHALDADRALAGVRLSYAVSEWVDLGDVYPPARSALQGVRDTKAESLMKGNYDASLFHDVASINRALGQVESTRDLFKTIASGAERGVAEKCFHIALESLVLTKEFGLARTFMPDPQKEIDQFAMPFKFVQREPVSEDIFREALIGIYVKKVKLILEVLIGTGDEDVANNLRDYAVECVPDAGLRDKITERLYSSPPSARIQ